MQCNRIRGRVSDNWIHQSRIKKLTLNQVVMACDSSYQLLRSTKCLLMGFARRGSNPLECNILLLLFDTQYCISSNFWPFFQMTSTSIILFTV